MAYQTITIARDSDLETLPDGGAQIYWSSQATWGMSAGAAGVRMQVLILSTTANTYGSIFGQWSIDGRTWTDFELPIDGQDPETMLPLSPTNGQVSHRQYAGPPWEMGPYVRYSVKIWRDDGSQGRVRMSCDIVVLPTLDAARLMIGSGIVISATADEITGNGQVGNIECTYGYDRGSIYIRNTVFTGLTSISLVVETTYFMNENVPDQPEHWRLLTTVPALVPFVLPDPVPEEGPISFQNIEVAGLDAYTRVRAVEAYGTGSATFSLYAFLRPAD